jgi:hypothetical protein
MAIVATIAKIATVTTSSIRVKPELLLKNNIRVSHQDIELLLDG